MRDFLERFSDVNYITQLLKVTQFNNYLLIPIKVIKKISDNRYQLSIGNKEIETTSYIDIEDGVKYWGELSLSKEGQMMLRNLKKQPKILQMEAFPLALQVESLAQLLRLSDPVAYLKNTVLELMGEVNEKNHLNFWSICSYLSSNKY